MYKMKL